MYKEIDYSKSDKETIIEKATLYEHAEMYDDMLEEMRKLAVASVTDFGSAERKLFSNAYKNVVGKKRSAWRAISLVHQNLEEDNPKKALVAQYSETIVKELRDDCGKLLALLENHVLPVSSKSESKVFFLKMKGDYLRYLVEVSSGEDSELKERSKQAYLDAFQVSGELAPTHSYRLGLALNFSVFQYEIENSPEKALELAKKAFDDANMQMDNLKEDEIHDATTIMQLLRDNLAFWSNDNQW